MSAWGWVEWLLNPPQGLSLGMILLISYVLGLLHGATPDEHTWPITFSYAVGKYSTKGGMKAGFLFSLGFTLQRALLTTLGFLGLAYFYQKYNLDGPVYVVVGIVMAIAGSYILKGKYLHLELDRLLGSRTHGRAAERKNIYEQLRDVPLKMTIVHGLIAGFGFGAYASVITFILAPRVGSLLYAPLPGAMFGLGTMTMQIIFGAAFANLARLKGLGEEGVKRLGAATAGRTLYYGGLAFVVIGLLIVLFPTIDYLALSTGVPIPNLDAVDVGLILVLTVVGGIGIGSMIKAYRELNSISSATRARS
ncbi:hypothetical protein ASAC_0863 [Acidilobus saccharovorans 345-15]|uniref:Nickel/cobalt efflux system n=1 Tax=Acidilobus saccharovorans (strain DSM 16705 / JCM 18335 / VKM B-2471 / 345-15) TaxID=666510 RepID=D9Q1T1_ACIS3|nr:hypothetical protein [Acidilobus saccharovorans]ADL19269.1 hypothetical protein ASAC_0863 [Acidilobus saccharovorans 345-15]